MCLIMYELKEFQYLGHKLRVVVVDDDTFYFVASDVCKMLGITGGSIRHNIQRMIPSEERLKVFQLDKGIKVNDPSEVSSSRKLNYQAVLITEAGLYRLVMRSDKPEAKKYQKWVFGEVLPTLHRTGKYEMPNFLQNDSMQAKPQIQTNSHKVAHVREGFQLKQSYIIGRSHISLDVVLNPDVTAEKIFCIKHLASNCFDSLTDEMTKILAHKI